MKLQKILKTPLGGHFGGILGYFGEKKLVFGIFSKCFS
jgi:hypothetical protein